MNKPDDIRWKLLNEEADDAISTQSWFQLGVIYYNMAEFVTNEGKDAQYLRDQAYKFKLMSQREDLLAYGQSEVVSSVEILTAKGKCGACLHKNGDIYSISTALKLNPLPIKTCGNIYGCRCVYVPVID